MSVGQFIKDYQSIVGACIGAILNASISVTVALFISRRVAEGGKVRFFLNGLKLTLWTDQTKKQAKQNEAVAVAFGVAPSVKVTKLFAEATGGQLIGFYHLYNGYGIQKTLRAFRFSVSCCRKTVARSEKGKYLYHNLNHLDSIMLNPKDLLRVNIDIPLSHEIIDAIKKRECLVKFHYTDEKNKAHKITVCNLNTDSNYDFQG